MTQAMLHDGHQCLIFKVSVGDRAASAWTGSGDSIQMSFDVIAPHETTHIFGLLVPYPAFRFKAVIDRFRTLNRIDGGRGEDWKCNVHISPRSGAGINSGYSSLLLDRSGCLLAHSVRGFVRLDTFEHLPLRAQELQGRAEMSFR